MCDSVKYKPLMDCGAVCIYAIAHRSGPPAAANRTAALYPLAIFEVQADRHTSFVLRFFINSCETVTSLSAAIENVVMDLAPDDRIKAIATLLDALFRCVLHDEQPIFVSDEASLLDVSLATPDELIRRCSAYYGTSVTLADLRTPLWKLLPELEKRRIPSSDPR